MCKNMRAPEIVGWHCVRDIGDCAFKSDKCWQRGALGTRMVHSASDRSAQALIRPIMSVRSMQISDPCGTLGNLDHSQ